MDSKQKMYGSIEVETMQNSPDSNENTKAKGKNYKNHLNYLNQRRLGIVMDSGPKRDDEGTKHSLQIKINNKKTMIQINKYPRTHHIEGSRFQQGDEELDNVPYKNIKGQYLVIEEKMDGANSGISFTDWGELRLQSRGHYLTGGPREKHFNLFKTWGNVHAPKLWELLGKRYIMYGEWLYAKHTVFYNQLTHYFMEFDILDTETGIFLSTKQRQEMLKDYPFIESVKVLYAGTDHKKKMLQDLVTQSYFIDDQHLETLKNLAQAKNLDEAQVLKETDNKNLMEGLYLKIETENEVTERYKFVRHSFLSAVLNSEGHWLNRPIIANQLKEGIDIFSLEGRVTGDE